MPCNQETHSTTYSSGRAEATNPASMFNSSSMHRQQESTLSNMFVDQYRARTMPSGAGHSYLSHRSSMAVKESVSLKDLVDIIDEVVDIVGLDVNDNLVTTQ